MNKEKQRQMYRILSIYDRLLNGQQIIKKDEALNFAVSEKSIQRDIDNIRAFVEIEKNGQYVDFNRSNNTYSIYALEDEQWLSKEEVFAVLKILIESRAFLKEDMQRIIGKLAQITSKEDRLLIQRMMLNEQHLYVQLAHKKTVFATLWQLAEAIYHKRVVRMHYVKNGETTTVERVIKPLGIVFSEYYFYVMAQPVEKDYEFPTIYRVDRIESIDMMTTKFTVPYNDRFQEGEFKKRVQFMYTGELIRLRFIYTGTSPQAVLDRLPTATIVKKIEKGIEFEAEVFGKGIKMWLLSQGDMIEVLEPQSFREEMRATIEQMLQIYKS